MIIYALIVRTMDGMALTATTDFNDESNHELKENKRYVKLVAKKTSQFPDRCTLNLGIYAIHFISAGGLSFLGLCESSYPTVLAFSFLNELQKEFIVKYEKILVTQARRPYSFIEFDNFIHLTRQRYNKPQSLTTRINLSELSTEIKQRPPHIIQLSQIEPINNGFHSINLTKLSVGPPSKLEPLQWHSVILILLSFGLSFIAFYRGITLLGASIVEEYDAPSSTHGFLFLLESTVRIFQICLLMVHTRYRILESWILLGLIGLCSLFLWGLRDNWQILLYAGCGIGMHICTITRKFEMKLPNYNV